MPHVILQSCCNDASCVPVCPVDCIHPRPDEPGFMRAEMLHIDPDVCIDCGACVDECPVSAILPDDQLEEEQEVYLDLNAGYFESYEPLEPPVGDDRPWRKTDVGEMRVAVVGSGPSAFYSALELHSLGVAQIRMFDKLLTPYGLARFGVAPDHQSTKAVTDMFRTLGSKPNFALHLGVEIGNHLSHAELLEHHDAVIYAVGASSDRRLGIDGEDLAGSHAATEFVGWYNGHPEHAGRQFDLSGRRAVIVGNGNVALDVARVLLADTEYLERTDIADHALDALRQSNIREVVVLGRRGVAQAAYTNPEMLALLASEDIDVVIDAEDVAEDEVLRSILADEDTEAGVRAKVRSAQSAAARSGEGSGKRLVMRYLRSPVAIIGETKVAGVRTVRNRLELADDGVVTLVATEDEETIEADLVFRSVGYRGTPVADLPFDDRRGIIPNTDGRVLDAESRVVPGVYVTGWIKRGPTGVIGTNKKCAAETVDLLLQDYAARGATAPVHNPGRIAELIAERRPDALTFAEWSRVDKAERDAGKKARRPRVKFVDEPSILDVVRTPGSPGLDG